MPTNPTRVRLGRSGLMVSPICYGSWQLSPRFWGKQPEEELISSMRHALEVGVNFYDTADAYGDGYAEQVMGKALKTLPRDKVVVATKVYWHFYPDGRRHPDLSYDYVLEECDASLKRLQMDYIDLYQCHSWDPVVPIEETTAALEKLVKQGKVRAYGVSNWTVEQMRTGMAIGKFATSQPPFSLIRRDIESDHLPYCQANDMGVLVYSPLHMGLLSGKYKGGETFDDFRKDSADFKGDRFKMICGKLQSLAPMAEKYGLNITQLVLTVTLMSPAITCAIVGIKNPTMIEEAAAAMGKTVSREDYHQVRSVLSIPK